MSELNYSNYPLNNKEKEEILNIENNFNFKVSSLGDIYSSLLKNQKELKNDNKLENIDKINITKNNDYFSHYIKNKNNILIKRNKTIKNQYFNHSNKIFEKEFPNNNTFNEQSFNKNNSLKNIELNNSRKLNVNILHPVPLKKSNKFHHIKGGKINPVKLNFNVKNIIMNNIKEHEKSMQQIKIYPNKVIIDNSNINENKTLKRNSTYNDFNQNFKTDKMMVIGQSFDPKNKTLNESHVSMSYSLPQKNNVNNINKKDYFYNNFEIRKTLEKGELLTKTINDYFYYNNKKIKNKYSLKTIVKYAKDLEKNLDNFEINILNNSKSKQKYINKKKKKNKKFIPNKKIYLEFDKNYIKEIQEKLSLIHLELRQICDNISLLKENNKDENKIKSLIEKTKNMNKLLFRLADEIKIEEKKLKESSTNNNNNILNKSLSYSKLNNTLSGFKSNFNLTKKSSLKQTSFNPIVESLNFSTKKNNNNNNNSFNLNNSKNNTISNLNKSKSFTNIKNKKINNSINKENLNNNNILSTNSQTNFNNNNISKNNTLSNFMNTNNYDYNNTDTSNKSMLSTFKYSFNNPKKIDLNNKTQTNIFFNTNNLDNNNNLISNSFLKASLKNTLIKPNIPQNNLTISQSVINDQTKIINQLDFSPEDIKLDSNPLKIIKDERFSAYNIEYPPQYYYEIIKQNEPLKKKDWFIRPHHIESISNSKKAINDDILNTKYISYYGKPEINDDLNNKNREEILTDLINETKNNIDILKNEMFNKSKLNTKNKII